MFEISKYCLPDIKLLEEDTTRYLVWMPDRAYIVLGASNRPEESLHIERVVQDKITVLKRPSGGQTVMLTPNNLIIAVVYDDHRIAQPKSIFLHINGQIISALEETGINNLSMMGISDIALSGKKILGSAIYRSRDKLLYHAVLNVGEPPSTFEKYLKHPAKEPDYRNGRKHIDFVTSLKENGYGEVCNQLVYNISYIISRLYRFAP